MNRTIRIGTRESRLAVIQAELVAAAIRKSHPEIETVLVTMKTTGDKILDKSLDKIGGKGLFVKELDEALRRGDANICVHSYKDLPAGENPGLPIVAVSPREDARDVLILPIGADSLDPAKPIGCSSKRRQLQLQKLYPNQPVVPIRGNVLTRLEKLDRGEYSALVLAAAGIKRLGLWERVSRAFSCDELLPAGCQGILAVQGRGGEDYSYLAQYHDSDARDAATAERAFLERLDCGCGAPVGVFGELDGGLLRLRGMLADEDGRNIRFDELTGAREHAAALGAQLAEIMLNKDKQGSGTKNAPIAEQGASCVQLQAGGVVLIGAGPGNAGLLTLRGKQVLEAADVVLYDRLVSDEILAMIPSGTQTVDVGKKSGRHLIPQREINEMLLRYAREGKYVARLKGGDPYLFGRGAEELEAVIAENIPFEVVPGVTSATAAPAFAGIPVSHREYASSVHIITAHRKNGKTPDIDYASLVKLNGTLIFLMGVSSIEAVTRGLLDAGIKADTPAALVENGTRPNQRKLVSTVQAIAEKARTEGFCPPSVLIVGAVCSLSRTLDWFSGLPLTGVRVVVTRAKATGSLSQKLRESGAFVTDLPCILTEPLPLERSVLESATENDWLVFTSPVGAEIFFSSLKSHGLDIRRLNGVKLAAVGAKTAAVIEERGLYVDFVPEVYCAKALGDLPCPDGAGSSVMLFRAENGTPSLAKALRERGFAVNDVPAYKTLRESPNAEAASRAFENGEVDFVTFTSASTVEGFTAALPQVDYTEITCVCIGEETAAEARKHGFKVLVSARATIESMIECIKEARNQ